MAFKSVDSSLDKIVERTKKSQIQAALAVQRLSRDHKRDHTILLVWKLLMKIARCAITATGSKPDDNLVVYVLMVVVRDKQTTFKAMFDCAWGEALLVLDQHIMRLPKLKDAPKFLIDLVDPHKVARDDELINIANDVVSASVTTPTGDNTTTAAAATAHKTADAEASTPSLNTCKANLSLRFQKATTESASSTKHNSDARAVVMMFPLKNRKTETADSALYYNSLKTHISKFLNSLVLEEDDTDGNAADQNYVHRGVLVKKSTPPTSTAVKSTAVAAATTNNRASTTPKTTDPSASASTTKNPATVDLTRENTEAATSNTSTSSTSGREEDGEGEMEGSESSLSQGVEALQIEDPLANITSTDLEIIVATISDAFRGMIYIPFEKYIAAKETIERGITMHESILEAANSEKAEDALELVHNDEKVTPPVLKGVIQKEMKPLVEEVKRVSHLGNTLAGMTPTQKRNRQKRAAKKRKREADANGDTNDKDDTSTAQTGERKKSKKSKSKNSDSHPETAQSVTQKKTQKKAKQNAEKNERGASRRGKRDEKQAASSTPTQQKGRNSKQRSRGKRSNTGNH